LQGIALKQSAYRPDQNPKRPQYPTAAFCICKRQAHKSKRAAQNKAARYKLNAQQEKTWSFVTLNTLYKYFRIAMRLGILIILKH
ncbi:MAG: hypothetical protein ABJD13_17910, partial [Paracoccaceae bacterium]